MIGTVCGHGNHSTTSHLTHAVQYGIPNSYIIIPELFLAQRGLSTLGSSHRKISYAKHLDRGRRRIS